ncbi:Uncharacterised protein [uncultured archaeon]|nr:Uncharacterised protein [uncultured archaeon]
MQGSGPSSKTARSPPAGSLIACRQRLPWNFQHIGIPVGSEPEPTGRWPQRCKRSSSRKLRFRRHRPLPGQRGSIPKQRRATGRPAKPGRGGPRIQRCGQGTVAIKVGLDCHHLDMLHSCSLRNGSGQTQRSIHLTFDSYLNYVSKVRNYHI